MTYELEILFGASLLYLLILFLVAYATDSGLVPEDFAVAGGDGGVGRLTVDLARAPGGQHDLDARFLDAVFKSAGAAHVGRVGQGQWPGHGLQRDLLLASEGGQWVHALQRRRRHP